MEGDLYSGNGTNRENKPRKQRRNEEEAEKAHPNRCRTVKNPNQSIGETKREQRCTDETDREEAENRGGRGSARSCARRQLERPGLVQQNVGQEKNGLNDGDENHQTFAKGHGYWIQECSWGILRDRGRAMFTPHEYRLSIGREVSSCGKRRIHAICWESASYIDPSLCSG